MKAPEDLHEREAAARRHLLEIELRKRQRALATTERRLAGEREYVEGLEARMERFGEAYRAWMQDVELREAWRFSKEASRSRSTPTVASPDSCPSMPDSLERTA